MSTRLPAAERREQLLDAAMTAFAANGYHGTSMNDVAKAARDHQTSSVPALRIEEASLRRTSRRRGKPIV